MKTDKSDKVIRFEMDAFHPVGVFDKILSYFDIITSDKKKTNTFNKTQIFQTLI